MHAAGWLWCYRNSPPLPVRCTQTGGKGPLLQRGWGGFPESAGILPAIPFLKKIRSVHDSSHWQLTALLTFSALWIAFWNTPTSIDHHVLFEQARYLSRFGWSEFLDVIAHRPYVEYQPPFLTFCFSRIPVFWLHQLLLFPCGLLCVALMWQLYDRRAALLCATPVFALVIHQPCTDTILFAMLLMVLWGCQMARTKTRRPVNTIDRMRNAKEKHPVHPVILSKKGFSSMPWAAVVLYGLTWMIKPLTIVTAPFILPQLGVAGIGSLAVWGGYVWWSQQWEFGRHQWQFLLHQLLITRMTSSTRRTPRPPSRASRLTRLWYTFLWRWRHIGHKAVKAFPLYLFPAWLRPWTWKGMLLAAIIILGYGNSKYLLLDLLFLFPIQEDAETTCSEHS